MPKVLPATGQTWRKHSTGSLVTVMRLAVDSTNSIEANIWVVFTPFGEIDGQWYIREIEDFMTHYAQASRSGGAIQTGALDDL